MNTLAEALKLPWTAGAFAARWIAIGLAVLIAIVMALTLWLDHTGDRVVVCTVLAGIGIAPLWLLVLPNALWIARAARALRLPRLGEPARTRRAFVWACLAEPLCAFSVLIALLIATNFATRMPGIAADASLSSVFAWAALCCAWILRCRGDGQPSLVAWIACAVVLLGLNCAMFANIGGGARVNSTWLAPMLLSLAFIAGFATLAWRGWRALQQRPHPFLATTP